MISSNLSNNTKIAREAWRSGSVMRPPDLEAVDRKYLLLVY